MRPCILDLKSELIGAQLNREKKSQQATTNQCSVLLLDASASITSKIIRLSRRYRSRIAHCCQWRRWQQCCFRHSSFISSTIGQFWGHAVWLKCCLSALYGGVVPTAAASSDLSSLRVCFPSFPMILYTAVTVMMLYCSSTKSTMLYNFSTSSESFNFLLTTGQIRRSGLIFILFQTITWLVKAIFSNTINHMTEWKHMIGWYRHGS